MDLNFEPASFMWIEEGNGNGNGNGQASTPRPRKKTKRKVEYVDWGSKELIEFLQSIDKDTTKALTQHEVSNIINQYVNENKLVHPNNKRRVLSDDKLFSIFNKKSFFRNKIHEFLEIHLVENRNESDDNHSGSSDENDGDASAASKKQRTLKFDKKILTKKKAPEVSKSCLVAINSDNIKLVYLRKSLVQELHRNPETFENKVVGSYVRVKSDPHDIFQKNSHQLQLVTAVMEVAVAVAGDTKLSKYLQFSGMADNISISELSDDNFSEEEIEDLRTRFKDGLLKQPTIGEFEQKVVLLHEDITKNWLTRELKLLKNLMDRANEKGWRHRVNECLDRRKLLESPAEQSRLLGEIPKVMPEEVKPVETFSDSAPDDSPKTADWDWEPYIDPLTEVAMRKPEGVLSKQDCQGAEISARSNGKALSFSPEEKIQTGIDPSAIINNGHVPKAETKETEAPKSEATTLESNGHTETLNASHVDIPSSERSHERNDHLQLPTSKEPEKVEVYVISSDDDDDDDEQKTPGGGGTQIPGLHSRLLGTPGGSGTQIPGPHHKLFGTPGGDGTQIVGSRPNLLGTLGGGIQSFGNGIQIPGSGIQNAAGGSQISGSNPGQVMWRYLHPQFSGGNQIQAPHPELLVWNYYDPQGRIQGPFSLMSLKRWSDLRYFPLDFKVWMSGQNPNQAVHLNRILQQMFPN